MLLLKNINHHLRLHGAVIFFVIVISKVTDHRSHNIYNNIGKFEILKELQNI